MASPNLQPPTLTPEQRALAVKALKVVGALTPLAIAYGVAALSGHPIPLDFGAIMQAVAGALMGAQ